MTAQARSVRHFSRAHFPSHMSFKNIICLKRGSAYDPSDADVRFGMVTRNITGLLSGRNAVSSISGSRWVVAAALPAPADPAQGNENHHFPRFFGTSDAMHGRSTEMASVRDPGDHPKWTLRLAHGTTWEKTPPFHCPPNQPNGRLQAASRREHICTQS